MGLVCSWQKSPRWFGAVFLLAFSGAVIWTSQQYIFIEHLLYARHCSACWRLSRTVCSFHIYDLTEFEYRGRALHWEPNSGFSCDFACPTSLHWSVFLVLCSLHHDILFFLNVESALGRWKVGLGLSAAYIIYLVQNTTDSRKPCKDFVVRKSKVLIC